MANIHCCGSGTLPVGEGK